MTFIEEEMETLERSPEYKRFLKVYIKYQIHNLVQKLSDVGEESFLVTASVADGTFSHVGSSIGEVFLDKVNDITWKFLSFCSSTDQLPRISSPEKHGSDSAVPIYTAQEHENEPGNICNIQTIESGSAMEAERLYWPEAPTFAVKSQMGIMGGLRVKSRKHGHLGVSRKSVPRKRVDHVMDSRNGLPKQLKMEPDDSEYDKSEKLGISNQVHALNEEAVDESYPKDFQGMSDDDSMYQEGRNNYINHLEASHTFGTNLSQNLDIFSALTRNNKADKEQSSESYTKLYQSATETDAAKLIQNNKQEVGSVDLTVREETITEQASYEDAASYFQHVYPTGRLSRQCPVCHKTFSSASYMTIHMRLHTGERPYKCSHCTASFAQKHVLVHHVRTHTGERPYKCPHCPKTFTVSCNLNSHMRTHTGERPYQCKICDMYFGQYSSLTAHMKSMHG